MSCNIKVINDVVNSAGAKFIESVDLTVVVNNIGKRVLRGIVDLPYGIGREKKIAVFAEHKYIKSFVDAGADIVGGDDLIQLVLNGGDFNYDWVVSTPSFISNLSKISKFLGPKGLMPNSKFNTVTFSAEVIRKLKSNYVKFKSDGNGVIHIKIGNISYDFDKLQGNLDQCLYVIKGMLLENEKSMNIKSVYLSSTMGKNSYKLENY